MALPEPEHLLRTVSGINPIRGWSWPPKAILSTVSPFQHAYGFLCGSWRSGEIMRVNISWWFVMVNVGLNHSWDLADGLFSASWWSGQRTRNWEKSLPMFINCSWEIGPQIHRRSLDKPCLRFWFIMAIVITEAKENPHCYQPLQMNHRSKRVLPRVRKPS